MTGTEEERLKGMEETGSKVLCAKTVSTTHARRDKENVPRPARCGSGMKKRKPREQNFEQEVGDSQ